MERAFSLVELSIVLVILGLLTGGILSGQSLIRGAELRAVSTEHSFYITAIQSFRDRYMALPGDMRNATSFWGKSSTYCASDTGTAATTGTCNGNGDGRIGGHAGAAANVTREETQAWRQMALAGLVEGTYTGVSGGSDTSTLVGQYASIPGTNIPRSKLSLAAWGAMVSLDPSYNVFFQYRE